MPNQPSITGAAPSRILVRGVNWLGDAVMSSPALLRLRERFPTTHIALATPAKLADLWREHPAVNETIASAPGDGVFAVASRLRRGNFDIALVFPNSPRSALEAWLARIPRRVGYARPWRNWLLTDAIPPRPGEIQTRKRSDAEIRELISSNSRGVAASANFPPAAHHIRQYLHLTEILGANAAPIAPQIHVSAGEVEDVQQKFQLGNPQLIIGLNPGAEYGPAKRWPAERFAAVAREIRSRTNCTWLLFGTESDRALAGQIESSVGGGSSVIRNLAGQTSLRELCALLKLCRVVLTNDTGPMHLAAALGTPVVVPFGSTSPELTGPGLPGDARHALIQSDAACSPCFRRECPIDFRCMLGISTDAVASAVLRIVRDAGQP